MKKQFDQLDHQIIQALHKDARLSASQIARDLNANERTIRKRIDRLVRLGAVRLTAIIDPEVFGYLTAVDIFLEVDADKEEEVIKNFKTISDISYIALGEGTKDLSIECRFKTNEDLREFIRKKIPTIEGVQIRGYSLVPRIIRNIDEWMPRDSDFRIERDEEDDY
ncbi:MAG: Lrp/AsnC family transcriptional regulator [Chloroflexi bacterium]|jgi:Lrp/AsnC family transcriptional regulator for asnA, asnC and gidA|nr:Lrp/AsnC family transcriptional regulator [Chloroflexota bacterium]